jgi:hypothetical protein
MKKSLLISLVCVFVILGCDQERSNWEDCIHYTLLPADNPTRIEFRKICDHRDVTVNDDGTRRHRFYVVHLDVILHDGTSARNLSINLHPNRRGVLNAGERVIIGYTINRVTIRHQAM